MSATASDRLEGRPLAPAGVVPRGVAFSIDAAWALAVALGLHLVFARPGEARWPALGVEPSRWLHLPSLWALALLLVAGRDVPSGASLGKWMLCLRLVDRRGDGLPLRLRLVRAPLSLLPLDWLLRQLPAGLPWRVVAFVPSRAGFALRIAVALAAAGASLGGGLHGLHPSISREDAQHLMERTLERDPLLRRTLGGPLRFEFTTVAPQARAADNDGKHAEFSVRVRGRTGEQTMRVRALRVEGNWVIDEVVDIQTVQFAGGNWPPSHSAR